MLLNHLSIDGQGRIVFDSSDDAVEESPNDVDNSREGSEDPEHPKSSSPAPKRSSDDAFEDVEIDITPLANQFFPDLTRLDEQDICPSLKNFDLGDPSGSLDIPFLKAPEEWRNEKGNEDGRGGNDASGIMLDDDNAVGFDDDMVL